jgi:hypothetical protein
MTEQESRLRESEYPQRLHRCRRWIAAAVLVVGFFASTLTTAYLGRVSVHIVLGVAASLAVVLTLLTAVVPVCRPWHGYLACITSGLTIGCDIAGALAFRAGRPIMPLHVLAALAVTGLALTLVMSRPRRLLHPSLGALLVGLWASLVFVPWWLGTGR